MPINFSTIGEVKFEHHEYTINQLLQDGWIMLREPCCALRRVERNDDGKMYLIDIPFFQQNLAIFLDNSSSCSFWFHLNTS